MLVYHWYSAWAFAGYCSGGSNFEKVRYFTTKNYAHISQKEIKFLSFLKKYISSYTDAHVHIYRTLI